MSHVIPKYDEEEGERGGRLWPPKPKNCTCLPRITFPKAAPITLYPNPPVNYLSTCPSLQVRALMQMHTEETLPPHLVGY